MRKKAASKIGKEARRVRAEVRQQVLHEAGYKCANPCCRHPLTLDIHHLLYVSESGTNDPENLLPLCPNCHTLHHNGNIPTSSLRAWKFLLLALNEAFDRRSVDLLLTIDRLTWVEWITGDGIIAYAALAASNLIELKQEWHQTAQDPGAFRQLYRVRLTEKGKQFVEAWKKGDQQAAVELR